MCPVCKIMFDVSNYDAHIELCKKRVLSSSASSSKVDSSQRVVYSPKRRHRLFNVLRNDDNDDEMKTSKGVSRINKSHLPSPSTTTTTTTTNETKMEKKTLERLRNEYVELYKVPIPTKFNVNKEWLCRKIDLKKKNRLVKGQKIALRASFFGKEWAQSTYGKSWETATCVGTLGPYDKSRGMWSVKYKGDKNTYFAKEKDLISF